MAKLYSVAESIVSFQDAMDWNAALNLNERVKRYQNGWNNPDIDTAGTPETVWPEGGLVTFPAATGATTIVSGSANDTAAGTGARTVLVEGLLAGYVANSETVTLNGTTPVALASNYLRINRITVQTAGTGQTNAGKLTVAVGGTTANIVAAGMSISQSAFYTIAENYQKALITYIFYNSSESGTGHAEVELVKVLNGVRTVIQQYGMDLAGSSFLDRNMHSRPIILEPKTDILVNVIESSVNNLVFNGVWTILLIE